LSSRARASQRARGEADALARQLVFTVVDRVDVGAEKSLARTRYVDIHVLQRYSFWLSNYSLMELWKFDRHSQMVEDCANQQEL